MIDFLLDASNRFEMNVPTAKQTTWSMDQKKNNVKQIQSMITHKYPYVKQEEIRQVINDGILGEYGNSRAFTSREVYIWLKEYKSRKEHGNAQLRDHRHSDKGIDYIPTHRDSERGKLAMWYIMVRMNGPNTFVWDKQVDFLAGFDQIDLDWLKGVIKRDIQNGTKTEYILERL